MNYGYNQGYQPRPQQQYDIPTPQVPRYGQQAPSGLQQYAQGLDRNLEMMNNLRSLGYDDNKLKELGFDPTAEKSLLSGYGGLLNARDQLKRDAVEGIGKGVEYAGTQIGKGALAAGKAIGEGAAAAGSAIGSGAAAAGRWLSAL